MKAIIFDLYGTLIEKTTGHSTYVHYFKDAGLTADRTTLARTVALTQNFSSLRDFAMAIDCTLDTKPYEVMMQRDVAAVRLFPDTIATLQKIREKKVRIGLISNLSTPYKQPFFDLGLAPYFDSIIFSCDAGVKKPNPNIFLQALAALEAAPQDAVMIGDSVQSDFKAAKALGMHALLLDRSQQSQLPTTQTIQNLAEILSKNIL